MIGKELAPIALFTYNRPEYTYRLLNSLINNHLAANSQLYIFVDGPRTKSDEILRDKVLEIVNSIRGFAKKKVIIAETNRGLAASVIDGVNYVLLEHSKVIVLEDDLLLSQDFLDFMNRGLNYYEDQQKVLSICGFTLPINISTNCDAYFGIRSSSWGWATWKSRWIDIDWDYPMNYFKLDRETRDWLRLGGSDVLGMIRDYNKGRIDSWAIRFTFHQAKNRLYALHPVCTRVRNVGFGLESTHTKGFNRFDSPLYDGENKDYQFPSIDMFSKKDALALRKFYSFAERLKSKLQ